MKLQKLYSYVRRAVDDYQMITEEDRIAIGISGGKDSLALLYALAGLRHFYPEHFDIIAVTVNVGFDGMDFSQVAKLCEKLDVEYHIIDTDIKKIVFDERRESNPCSLGAKMRKGALNDAIKVLGCNKVAYAHHRDDVVETMLLSLLYEGRFHSFAPVTYLDRTQLTVIRPLIYVHEADVIGFVNRYDVPVVKSTCPADGNTKREYVHLLLKDLMKEDPAIKNRMFSAITDSTIKGWHKKEGAHY